MALGLFHLAHEENIIVEWYPFRTPLVGYYWQTKSGYPVIGLSSSLQHQHAALRSILAEELGHHFTSTTYSICKTHYRYSDRLNVSQCEERALRWAASYLIPFKKLVKARMNGIDNPWELAEHFNVLEEIVTVRLRIFQLQGEWEKLCEQTRTGGEI
ncbi:hypothetical protein GCM10011571_17570 [Marinithermofilum abyssi]|uniref:IrrE N-terminal-like domain-containing protein n=1 Tax=Marinithermofilum abyssi TaxID=1571185 RepID=A0A8J2YE10_9BACL|nr:ImmA/IrrE family metallo-endopeptidase [Marinithermofilum abyssi]GGE16371.1 hypothetical protein GCM10011571_17570 [Marinithermofilum abyssi]